MSYDPNTQIHMPNMPNSGQNSQIYTPNMSNTSNSDPNNQFNMSNSGQNNMSDPEPNTQIHEVNTQVKKKMPLWQIILIGVLTTLAIAGIIVVILYLISSKTKFYKNLTIDTFLELYLTSIVKSPLKFSKPGDFYIAIELKANDTSHIVVPRCVYIANNGDICFSQLDPVRSTWNLTKGYLGKGWGLSKGLLGTLYTSNMELPKVRYSEVSEADAKKLIKYADQFLIALTNDAPCVYHMNYTNELVVYNLKDKTLKNIDNPSNTVLFINGLMKAKIDPDRKIYDQYDDKVKSFELVETESHACKVSDMAAVAAKLGKGEFFITIGDGVSPYYVMKDSKGVVSFDEL